LATVRLVEPMLAETSHREDEAIQLSETAFGAGATWPSGDGLCNPTFWLHLHRAEMSRSLREEQASVEFYCLFFGRVFSGQQVT
jgi:hypothetical protein